jgi:hypothetical protein
MISHGEVEASLRHLEVKQVAPLWRHLAWRVSWREWRIDGGEPIHMLRAIDALMSRQRPRLAFRERSGQNCMASNGKQGGSG